jgi:hypothetical protein
MTNLKQEYQEKLNIFKEKMEQYCIVQKLIGKNIDLQKCSVDLYDSYDWTSPICPGYKISTDEMKFSIGINPNDGEIVIEIYDKEMQDKIEANKYLIYLNEHEINNKEDRISVRKEPYHFWAYIYNHYDAVKNILDLYLV